MDRANAYAALCAAEKNARRLAAPPSTDPATLRRPLAPAALASGTVPAPEIALEAYALLCAELAAAPEREPAILAKLLADDGGPLFRRHEAGTKQEPPGGGSYLVAEAPRAVGAGWGSLTLGSRPAVRARGPRLTARARSRSDTSPSSCRPRPSPGT